MKDDVSREMAVFTEVIKIARQQRASFLDNACGGDEDLRRKVEALVRAHDRIGNFLEEPPTGGPSSENN
jgi:eukaryotic-like serine/threonine-protein kinase